MMPKQILALLCLLCVTAAASAQTEVKDSLGVDSPSANTPATLLKGRVPGVLVTATDGSPAGALSTFIRGINALGDDSQPLWIVDGVMLNRSQKLNLDPFWNVPGSVYAPAFNELAFLNPYDIESVEVLKDAAATALYGSRGANGVIIVTTGKAHDKQLDIRWDSNVSFSTAANKVDGVRSALGHNHSVRVSTNRNLASYYLSGFFREENGVVAGSQNRYGGLRIGFDASASSVFQTGLNCAVTVGRQGSPATVAPVGQPSRTLSMRYSSLPGCSLEGWDEDYVDYANEYRLVNSAYLNINFTDQFSLRSDLGVDYQNTSRYFWLGNGTPFGLEKNGANAILTGSTFAYNAKMALHYETASDGTEFTVDGGAELLGGREKLTNMNGMDFFSHFLREKGINIMASKPESHRVDEKTFHYGLFLHPTLLLNQVVGLDAVVRADTNPQFDHGKFTWYPAATLFANLHEVLFPGSDIVDQIKVSGGYGAAGTERTAPWITLDEFALATCFPPTAGTEDFFDALYRTRTSEYNVRVELGFADQVRLSGAYYNRNTRENLDLYIFGKPMLLTPEYFEATDGYRFAILNDFNLKNSGFEFDASFDIIKHDGLLWNVNANAAFNEFSTPDEAGKSLERLFPKWYGGAGTTVSAGGFTFDALATFVGGHEILNLNTAAKDGVPENLEPLYEKGHYFRLSRVSLSYDLPVRTKWLQGVRVLLSGNNLLTVSKYTGWNPDVNCFGRQGAQFGIDYGSYPSARTFLLGIHVNF